MLGLGSLGLVALSACTSRSEAASTGPEADQIVADVLGALEKASGGRLGVAILDCKDGTLVGHRTGERFTMCSTFKLSLAANILARMDAGEIASDSTLPITTSDPVGHSPTVRAALDKGQPRMNILALAEAAQLVSDNGAANILLRHIGGPAALTAFWRALGDGVTRLDRYEPELNTSRDGDPRDTTTPAAMANAMRSMLVRPALLAASRARLIGWMETTQTGLKRIRGGLPTGWRAGDKTGTANGLASSDKINDIAMVWRPGRAEPFMVTAFLESAAKGSEAIRPQDEAVLAEVGRIARRWMEARTA